MNEGELEQIFILYFDADFFEKGRVVVHVVVGMYQKCIRNVSKMVPKRYHIVILIPDNANLRFVRYVHFALFALFALPVLWSRWTQYFSRILLRTPLMN